MPDKQFASQRKKDGFNGQKAIVLPNKIVSDCQDAQVIQELFVTDIGFYPKAKYHYRERKAGGDQHILIYCTDGKGWFQTGKEENAIGRGQFFIIPAHTPHKYGSDENDPWSIYWLHFKGKSSYDLIQLLTKQQTQLHARVHFADERIKLFNIIYKTLESGYRAANLGYINMCLWHFLSSFCFPDVFQAPFKEEKDAIDISVEFMQKHLHETLTLKQLATEVHISPSHYSALFKKKTGYSPLEYFNHIKVQKACQYLQFTNLQVKEIGYRLGINDPFYFSRFFHNVMGLSPLEYRNRKQ